MRKLLNSTAINGAARNLIPKPPQGTMHMVLNASKGLQPSAVYVPAAANT